MLKVAVIVSLLWSGSALAAAGTLTREQALRMIQAHPSITTPVTTARIGYEELQAALQDGIATQPGAYEALTEKGRRHFSAYSMIAGATLVRPLRRVASSVTGIRDSGTNKIAEFTWHLDGLDSDTARYALLNNADQYGEALFRRYDDGWRIVTVKPKFKSGLPNTRPLLGAQQQSPADASTQVRAEICALATAWAATATDFNTYYLYEYRGEKPPLPIDDRKDGVRTVEQIRRAFVPSYMHPRKFPATDPYGNPYIFEVVGGGTEFVIISRGADGKPSGDDLMNVNGRWMTSGKMAHCF